MKAKTELLPFLIQIQPGIPVSEQLVYAAKKAVLSGLMKPGDRFPSVRVISQQLRIHPNTAQKSITALVNEGFLEVHPGVGTVVAQVKSLPTDKELKEFESQAERLVVEAKNHRLNLEKLQQIIEKQWKQLTKE